MNIRFTVGGWETNDVIWFLQNWKNIYHLACTWIDGRE